MLRILSPIIFVLLCCLSTQLVFAPNFSQRQLQNYRVQIAQMEKDNTLFNDFLAANVNYPPQRMFMRVFKSEKQMELWASNTATDSYRLIKTYDVCAMSGDLGPKRKQGDLQVPEGFYHINHFNPQSNYFLSMKMSYPNSSDRRLSRHSNLGGDIYIHGSCASLGCVSITDSYIKEVYWLSAQVKDYQHQIPVHSFPCRMSEFKYSILKHVYKNKPEMLTFWRGLKQGYDYFETHRQVPAMQVGGDGYYAMP